MNKPEPKPVEWEGKNPRDLTDEELEAAMTRVRPGRTSNGSILSYLMLRQEQDRRRDVAAKRARDAEKDAMVRTQRKISRGKMPDRYYQRQREEKRDRSIRVAAALGGVSRHVEDPEGSRVWVETGIWPKEVKA